MLQLIHYVREAICDAVFEIFIRSANQAKKSSTSSLTIFTVNLKELKLRSSQGFVIVLYLYRRIKQLVKVYFPSYGKIGSTDQNILLSMGQHSANQPCEFRDNTNQWFENNLHEIAKMNKNEHYSTLFRLLALRYRMKYPIRIQGQMKLDLDVRVRLENKICVGLLRLFLE